MNHFLTRLWCVMKSGFHTTTGDDQLSGWTEKQLQSTSQSQTCTKEMSWSLCVGLLPDPQSRSKSRWNHYIWEVCSTNQWDAPKTAMPAAGISQKNGLNSSPWQCPIAHHTTNNSKLERTGLWSFAPIAVLTWPLTNQLPLLQVSWQLFARKMLPQPAGGRNCFPRVQSTDFHATGINKLISHWQKCVDCNGSYFD